MLFTIFYNENFGYIVFIFYINFLSIKSVNNIKMLVLTINESMVTICTKTDQTQNLFWTLETITLRKLTTHMTKADSVLLEMLQPIKN